MKDLEQVERFHELLDITLRDVRALMGDPEWDWDLEGTWLSFDTHTACLAGAVMLYTCRVTPELPPPPSRTVALLRLINNLRYGIFHAAESCPFKLREHRKALVGIYRAARHKGYRAEEFRYATLSYLQDLRTYAQEHDL